MADPDVVVELLGISKRYGTTQANKEIDFDLRRGEIHVLLGENGAGKSTLMNIMFGHVLPDAGTIYVDGAPANIQSPADALELGIGMVHQHFSLVPPFTVAENVLLGSRPMHALNYSPSSANQEIQALSERFGMPVDPGARVRDLPVDLLQRVEILKVLHRGATILILDEPTSLLGPQQIENLLGILENLKTSGHSIVLVTHKLAEVTEVADRVTVIRQGAKVVDLDRGEFDEQTLTRAMTGQLVDHVEGSHDARSDAPVMLEARDLYLDGAGAESLDGLSLLVHAGEILGVAGVEGNGQRSLVNVLMGLEDPRQGAVELDGRNVTGSSSAVLREAGVSVIPEDRHGWGLILDMTLAENLAIDRIPTGDYTLRGLLDWRRIRRDARQLLEEYDVRPPDPGVLASSLSGGNQQKVVLARELSRQPTVLIADNPTWGLDVGAIEYVRGRLLEVKERGAAILLLSLDLDELLGLSDRLVVISRGRIVLERRVNGIDMDEVAMAMAGRKRQ